MVNDLAAWAVFAFALGGAVSNMTQYDIPVLSAMGDLTFAGLIAVIGLWGFLS